MFHFLGGALQQTFFSLVNRTLLGEKNAGSLLIVEEV